jgi:Ca2+-binding EF-hand superfamily protein
MKKTTKWILAGLAVTVLAGGAYAAQSAREDFRAERDRMGREMFEKADADASGAVSREEFAAVLRDRFSSADADANGSVSKAEATAIAESMIPFERAKRHSGAIADRTMFHLDMNADGLLQLSELENRAGKLFALVDFDDNGAVELAEIERLRSMRGGRDGGRRDGRHGGWRDHGGRD